MEEKIIYIVDNLQNQQVANDLLNAVERAILERVPDAERYEIFHSLKER